MSGSVSRRYGIVLAIGLALGGHPQGCEDAGRMAEPFRYLTGEEGYRPPAQGDVTFYQTNGPLGGGSVQTLAEGPDGVVYAGTFGNGIYTKPAGGDRWRPSEDGPDDRFLLTLTAMPDGVVLAGTVRGGIFRSEDGGRRWTAVNEGLGNTQVLAILRDPRSGTLYAGTGSGVFKSLDEGRRWTPSNRGLEMTLSRSLALGPDGTLYTGTGGNGLFASHDNGAVWQPLNEGLRDDLGLRENFVRVLTVDRLGVLYAGSFGGGVFKTTDEGRHWVSINEGLTNTSIRGLVVGPDALYVGTGEGVFTSSDGGARWESISQGMPDTNVQSLLLGTNGVLYAGTGSGVVERSPSGSWRSSERGMLFPSVAAVLVDPKRGLFAGTRSAGLFRSKDAGETWVPFNDGLPSPTIRALARDAQGVQYAATRETVYRADWTISRWVADGEGLQGAPAALLAGPDRLYAATSTGLFERANGTSTWARAALDGDETAVRAVISDRRGAVYAATQTGVFRRATVTDRWGPLATGPMDGVLGLAAGQALYAWTAATISRAVEDRKGTQWREIGSGLPKGLEVAGLAVDVVAGRDVVLAATTGGIWWNDREGGEWKPAQGRLPAIPFRTVLAAESGFTVAGSEEHGVFVGVNLVPGRRKFGLF
ncbi:MAG: hypothetical protein HY207_03225 [Nitrospirae bacterium]|nr:hypothetical protein [Nitrospirota bacterium]